MRLMHRAGLKRSPAQAPLRTVRESFPSHGSSLSKISLRRGDPAIRFLLGGILSCQLIHPGSNRTMFSNEISNGITAKDRTRTIHDGAGKRGMDGLVPPGNGEDGWWTQNSTAGCGQKGITSKGRKRKKAPRLQPACPVDRRALRGLPREPQAFTQARSTLHGFDAPRAPSPSSGRSLALRSNPCLFL